MPRLYRHRFLNGARGRQAVQVQANIWIVFIIVAGLVALFAVSHAQSTPTRRAMHGCVERVERTVTANLEHLERNCELIDE